MPRAIPSQITLYLSSNLGENRSLTLAAVHQLVGVVAGFLSLYDDLPAELMNLSPSDYATMVAAIGTIRLSLDKYRFGGHSDELKPICAALPKAWSMIALLPDDFPSAQHDLSFIGDPELRNMIGVDVAAIAVGLQAGEWKGATILAGSCSEALLLYALQEKQRKIPNSISDALAKISSKNKARLNFSDLTDQSWNLFWYTEVAHNLDLITDSTKAELAICRDYRNFIHPAKAIRLQSSCDRGTAFVSTGAIEHVIRDLQKSLQ